MQARGLKHAKPNLREFDKAKITDEMKDMLRELMDYDFMTDEILEAWD